MFSRHRLAALVVTLIALAYLGMACPRACRDLVVRCLETSGSNVPTFAIAAGRSVMTVGGALIARSGSVICSLQGAARPGACVWSPGASRCGTI